MQWLYGHPQIESYCPLLVAKRKNQTTHLPSYSGWGRAEHVAVHKNSFSFNSRVLFPFFCQNQRRKICKDPLKFSRQRPDTAASEKHFCPQRKLSWRNKKTVKIYERVSTYTGCSQNPSLLIVKGTLHSESTELWTPASPETTSTHIGSLLSALAELHTFVLWHGNPGGICEQLVNM